MNKGNLEVKEIKIEELSVKRVRVFGRNNTVSFDLTINGVTIYGCFVVEGEKGDFISFPSTKAKDGRYYNHAWCKLSDDDTKRIISMVENELNK